MSDTVLSDEDSEIKGTPGLVGELDTQTITLTYGKFSFHPARE